MDIMAGEEHSLEIILTHQSITAISSETLQAAIGCILAGIEVFAVSLAARVVLLAVDAEMVAMTASKMGEGVLDTS
jgi:hypothetical protein